MSATTLPKACAYAFRRRRDCYCYTGTRNENPPAAPQYITITAANGRAVTYRCGCSWRKCNTCPVGCSGPPSSQPCCRDLKRCVMPLPCCAHYALEGIDDANECDEWELLFGS